MKRLHVYENDWIRPEVCFLGKIVQGMVENALAIAVCREKKVRKEGGGIWNRSRAPHCYGYEYEQHFGKPCRLGHISRQHEAIWRKSAMWPNVPHPNEFYSDFKTFEDDCMKLLEQRALKRAYEEHKQSIKRKKEYELAYNEIRKKRRKLRKQTIAEYKKKHKIFGTN